MCKKADFVNLGHKTEYQYVQNQLHDQYCEYSYEHYISHIISLIVHEGNGINIRVEPYYQILDTKTRCIEIHNA